MFYSENVVKNHKIHLRDHRKLSNVYLQGYNIVITHYKQWVKKK